MFQLLLELGQTPSVKIKNKKKERPRLDFNRADLCLQVEGGFS